MLVTFWDDWYSKRTLPSSMPMTNRVGSHIEAFTAAKFLVFWCLASHYCTDIFSLRSSLHRISLYPINRFAPIRTYRNPPPLQRLSAGYSQRHSSILLTFWDDWYLQRTLPSSMPMTNRDESHIEAIPAARFFVFWLSGSFCTDIFRLRVSFTGYPCTPSTDSLLSQYMDIPLPYNVCQPLLLTGTFINVSVETRK
jgi:hypothetical protein